MQSMGKVPTAALLASLLKLLTASQSQPLAPEDIYSNLRVYQSQLTVEELAAALEFVEECYCFPDPPPRDYKTVALDQAKAFLEVED